MSVHSSRGEPAPHAEPNSTRHEPDQGFLRRNAFSILAWPVIGLLLAIVLWAMTLSQLEHDRQKVQANALRHATSLTTGYAEQLLRSVQQIERITLSLKYDWEAGVILDLKKQRQLGLYPDSAQFYASVVDRAGNMVTSTLGSDKNHPRVEMNFFLHHMTDDRQDMLISEPHAGRRAANPIIRFSRRIDHADGSFAGVALVTADPNYLLSFYDETVLGRDDFITVRRTDGAVLASRLGQGRAAEIFYRSDPVFASATGARVETPDRFWDNHARIVAWKKLDRYPLVALAALSEGGVFAAHRGNVRRTFAIATAGSIFLFLFASVGMMFSARLAWRRQQAEELKQTYRLAVDEAREGFYMLRPIFDQHGRATDFQVQDCNERAAALAGSTRAEFLGARLSEVYCGEYGRAVMDHLRHALHDGYFEDEAQVPEKSHLQASWVHRKVVRSGAGLAMTLRDISEAKAQQEALAAMANVDALTALPNRHWLGNFLPRALEQASSGDVSLAVLFVDLDDFKNINDTLGHAAGDELLKAAAVRLRSLVRASDHVVRLGGDEFTVVLQQVHRLDDVVRVARLIVNALSDPFALGSSSGHHVQASIGISVFPQDGRDGETLLKHADIAMYAAKAAGKGRYHFYHAHLSDSLVLRINREQALRQAIERDEFVLHYQPRVDAVSGRLVSVEALVRWIHPERGLVLPLEFIHVAEETGLIVKLGRMVIEKACAQIAQWKLAGLPVVPVSINVSALQFNDGHVRDILASCMQQYSIEPNLIGVELTESCMAGEDETVAGELDGLRALGVKLLVDDFGTGYSSLSQLQRMNVDTLKVDRAFTASLAESVEGKALYKAIVSMAAALDIGIVAEGVETAEQLSALQALHCDEVQGFFVSRPVSATDMPSLMIKRFLFPPGAARVGLALV